MSTSKDYRVIAEYPRVLHYSELGPGQSHPNDYIHPENEVLCGMSQDEHALDLQEKVEGWHDDFTRAAMIVVSKDTLPVPTLTGEDIYECEGGGPQ